MNHSAVAPGISIDTYLGTLSTMDSAESAPKESVVVERADQEMVDEYDLAALGHGQALSRKFDLWSILALAFCVLGTWSTFAQVGA